LLPLIKQLACPPMDTLEPAGHARICAKALEVYNKEQKDPSSRTHLNFNSTLDLLGHLIKCFDHPAVVLDALDECPEEVRGDLLRHFCIETRDIAEGIENYVQQQLISQELREYIEEVNLRDANGM